MSIIAQQRWIPWRLAVDVGVHGCVAALNTVTMELRLFELPYHRRPLASPKGKRKFESVALPEKWLELLESYAGAQMIAEDIAAFAGHHSHSEGSLLESFGMVQMAAAAKRISLVTVHPSTWKAFMFKGLGGARAEKSVSVDMARKLFPEAERALLKSFDGRADALNLLYYDLLGEAKRMEMTAFKQIPPTESVSVIFTGLERSKGA